MKMIMKERIGKWKESGKSGIKESNGRENLTRKVMDTTLSSTGTESLS